MLNRLFLFILMFSAAGMPAQAQAPRLAGWHLEPVEGPHKGISLTAAYQWLARQNLQPVPVTVGVLDSGIDTTHEDLRPVLWINEREIPGNGIDDDANGYTDDRYGWNFLGHPAGSNVLNNSSEWIRVYWRFRDRFVSLQAPPKDPADQYLYASWLKARSGVVGKGPTAGLLDTLAEQHRLLQFCDSLIRFWTGKDRYTAKELQQFSGRDDRERAVRELLLNFFSQFSSADVDNQRALAEFRSYISGETARYRAEHEPPRNERFDITGDDDTDPSSRFYGNGDVAAGETLHGTHVAGIIGAVRGNSKGMDGIAAKVRLLAVRTTTEGDEFDKDIAMGIRYAVDQGARVLNLSFGKSLSPDKYMIDEALRYAWSRDVLIVQAAGNSRRDIGGWDNYPHPRFLFSDSVAPNWITVGASDTSGRLAAFSNYGKPVVDILAPGVAIYAPIPAGNRYALLDGTSMAAPVVTGVAALLRSYFPRLTAVQIRDILCRSAVDPSATSAVPDEKAVHAPAAVCNCGGIVNALRAVQLAARYPGR